MLMCRIGVSLFRVILLLCLSYVLLCITIYHFQEKLLFYPEKLPKDFPFSFRNSFEEIDISLKDGKKLNALLFKSEESKGVILYFHGNAGSLQSWGEISDIYTKLGYDVCMFDYRGYGKSEGEITSKKELFDDAQTVYEYVKNRYSEERIIVLGYSIGTGIAAKIASDNCPKQLILQAPYYSLCDVMASKVSFIPTFILKYTLNTYSYLQNCSMPVTIIHGDSDEVIYYGSSLKLEKLFKEGDTLITLQGQKHNMISYNPHYSSILSTVLK